MVVLQSGSGTSLLFFPFHSGVGGGSVAKGEAVYFSHRIEILKSIFNSYNFLYLSRRVPEVIVHMRCRDIYPQ